MKTTREIMEWRRAHASERLSLAREDLSWADLREANLSEADLREANLGGASLGGANLHWANLRGASLRGAYLSDADLRWADLRWADLRGANLREANLRGANLRWADLRGASLMDVNLRLSVGIYLMNLVDPRGYVPICTVRDGEVRVISGCRDFTISEATTHWGESYEGKRWLGDRYIAGLKELRFEHFMEWLRQERIEQGEP